MTHQVELPDHVYQIIQQAAEKEGITPAQWIAATASRIGSPIPADEEPESAREALAPFIGAVDSSKETPDPRYRSEFGDIVDAKFEKQGIAPPKWKL